MGNLRRTAPAFGAAICLFWNVSLGAEDWTQFRGPNGQGHSARTDLPVTWSEHAGIVWKQAVPGRGWSSPVTLDNNVWLTTATENGHSLRVMCLAADTGQTRWNVEVFRPQNPSPINAKNSTAVSTIPKAQATGRLKIVFHRETRHLLGVHIIGEGASELLHIGQAVMALGGTLDYFIDTVFNYPTLAECYKAAAFNGINRLARAAD